MWRTLPGPWPVRLVLALILAFAVVALLFLVVFPWLEPRLPFNDVTVDQGRTGATVLAPWAMMGR
jgi:hypothetical protein